MTDLMTYQAAVDGEGYEWVEPADRKGYSRRIRAPWNPRGEDTPRLVLMAKHPEKMNRRTAAPTDEDTALYRNFAAMEPTPEQILEFVSRYGTLWDAQNECFEEWEFEVRTMRFLIEVWDSVKSRKLTGTLSQQFKADKSGLVTFPYANTVLAYEPWKRQKAGEHSGARHRVTARDTAIGLRGTPLTAAGSYVIQAINERISALGAQTALDWPNGQYRLVTRPHNLLCALWFQFASSISGQKSYRACDVCGRAMEISPDVNRSDRRYCSDACRSRALRRRQKQAVEMRESGKSLREIAKATGSDIDIIKKWLASREE